MTQRSRYWSCTKLADFVRGVPKGEAKTCEEWEEWHKSSHKAHPFRYWIAETLLNKIQNVLNWPADKIYSLKYYANNRWVTRTHSLTAHSRDIKPGEWCDLGNRFLPCMFNELVDFVEIELAWFHLVWDRENRKKYAAPWWAFGWWRIRTWRCAQAGLDHLAWAQTLTNEEWLDDGQKNQAQPTGQAVAAKEILELYTWWTQVYPNRPDPMDASGWSNYCELRRQKLSSEGNDYSFLDTKSKEELTQSQKILDKCRQIEESYAEEDEQMMIRLIRVRNSLWT